MKNYLAIAFLLLAGITHSQEIIIKTGMNHVQKESLKRGEIYAPFLDIMTSFKVGENFRLYVKLGMVTYGINSKERASTMSYGSITNDKNFYKIKPTITTGPRIKIPFTSKLRLYIEGLVGFSFVEIPDYTLIGSYRSSTFNYSLEKPGFMFEVESGLSFDVKEELTLFAGFNYFNANTTSSLVLKEGSSSFSFGPSKSKFIGNKIIVGLKYTLKK